MKLLLALALFAGITPDAVIELSEAESTVKRAEAVMIEGEWYVALITEPIYTLSERGVLSDKITNRIRAKTGKNAHVLADTSLYFDIAYYKQSGESNGNLARRIKTAFLKRDYEYKGNYSDQEKGLEAVK